MFVSLYGLGLALFLLVGAVLSRHFVVKALDNAAVINAKTLTPEQQSEKLRVRNIVAMVLNAELVVMPVIGYAIGAAFLEPR